MYQKLARNLREKGVLRTTDVLFRFSLRKLNEIRPSVRQNLAEERDFDDRCAIETAERIEIDQLDIRGDAREEAEGYWPSPVWVFKEAMQALAIAYQDYVFVDIGSGKGRTLLLASDFPFQKIVGIELSADLTRIAQDNIRRYRSASQRCCDITAICMNAISFPIPNEKLVLYLYNPFGEGMLRALLANINASWEGNPRDIFVIYTNPVHHRLLASMPALQSYQKRRRYNVYRYSAEHMAA